MQLRVWLWRLCSEGGWPSAEKALCKWFVIILVASMFFSIIAITPIYSIVASTFFSIIPITPIYYIVVSTFFYIIPITPIYYVVVSILFSIIAITLNPKP